MDPSLPPSQITVNRNGFNDDNTPKDPTIIIKGKRTKRQRPTNINLTHSSTSYNTLNSSSPTSSSNFPTISTTTEEDEYTANCLILLSKGSLANNINDEFILHDHNKFNSKKYIQDGGMYVYECKTCSRTFSSFQALGGHRASHKKPKINELDKQKSTNLEEDEILIPSTKNNSSSSISIQINQKKSSSPKLHECSICGAEFNSGQALGGHMRRHRVVNGNTTTVTADTTANTTLSLVPYNDHAMVDQENINKNNQKSRNDGLFFDLDLNLPAPPETTVAGADREEYRETSFKFMANQNKQQPAVHLSATPTLVDCHY
ncbi:zinc finger protein ZAT5-like [Rutidosis leptorrhynchoides]|uniref:zinc finger protein ZAT5-like n=1 Tax=Rutidosis leptorrhynchoides TaxID=125765 RepID=UPI003A9A1702